MPAVGIDLGTTYTCVAIVNRKGDVEVVRDLAGKELMPSVVHFGMKGSFVGEQALEQLDQQPLNTIYQVKRLMGRSIDDEDIVRCDFPFELIATDNRKAVKIRVQRTDAATGARDPADVLCPEQVSARIICCAKAYTEERLGENLTTAVITVPAHFTNAQREATILAGEGAGFKDIRIVNEPTAAALAYGHTLSITEDPRVILVYDLGGGTFDASIVEKKGLEAEVKSTRGEPFLGGEDFDLRLFAEAVEQFKNKGVIIPASGKFALLRNCKKAKEMLSNALEAEIETVFKGKIISVVITRKVFEKICEDLFRKTIKCVKDTIKSSQLAMEDIQDVVLVGGSSRIPRIRELLGQLFKDSQFVSGVQPDFAVAKGAAILADSVWRTKTAGARKGGCVRVSDRTPYTLGVALACDIMDPIIERNTKLPVTKVEYFANGETNQSLINFAIYEGESAVASHNNLLGRLKIRCNPKPIRENSLKATFAVDVNCVLTVHVQDEETGEVLETTVNTSKLTTAERNRMVKDTQKFGEHLKIQNEKRRALYYFANALSEASRQSTQAPELATLAEKEKNWIDCNDPSNDELYKHADVIHRALAAMNI